jgi:pimeloyl-ACP methyl ester carboxylesterase
VQLHLRRWGSGAKTALLVHGFSDDADTWWRVGPAVAALGYTVLAPDLRGHGRSPRGGSYSLEDFSQDLVDTLPVGADVAIGHSLGAIALGMAAGQLAACRTGFVDPAWLRPPADLDLTAALASCPEELPLSTALWDRAEVVVDLASNAQVDARVGPSLTEALRERGPLMPPPAPEPGSVVLVPALDPVLPVEAHPLLESLGYRVLTQPGVRHVMHRDDFAGFMDLLGPALLSSGAVV